MSGNGNKHGNKILYKLRHQCTRSLPTVRGEGGERGREGERERGREGERERGREGEGERERGREGERERRREREGERREGERRGREERGQRGEGTEGREFLPISNFFSIVGTAGTDEKCQTLLKKFGFDAAINYKTCKNLNDEIRNTCPKGVDVFFDNVGGQILDAALRRINDRK
jgi:hypothetical protein